MIRSKDIPAANWRRISSLTEFGKGRCLHSFTAKLWFVWVEIYLTSTLPSLKYSVAIILAIQKSPSLRV